jgi:hypothetical protein
MAEKESFLIELQTLPMSLLGTMLVVICLCAYVGLGSPPFHNPSFLVNQMALNFLLLITFSFVYGIVCLAVGAENPLQKYQNVFLPLCLIGLMWLKSYMIYSANLSSYCKNKAIGDDPLRAITDMSTLYRPAVLAWNSAKIAVAILVTYLFISLFSWTFTPFYEMFNTANPMVFFFAVGFWTGGATWAAEASAYFQLQKNGCVPQQKVSFASLRSSVAELPDPANPPTTQVH